MDSPDFRNYPCSSWLLVHGNTIEKPGNCSVQPTGLQKECGEEVAVWTPVWSSCQSMPGTSSKGTGLPQGIIHQSLCVWSPQRPQWLGQNCTPSPIHQGAVEGLRNHFSSLPGKKPRPPILLGYIVHVLWLLAPSRIKHSAWWNRTKSYPWTWIRINRMLSSKGKAAVHWPVVWSRSGGLMVERR